MLNFNKIAEKWQKQWEKDSLFSVEVPNFNKKKYFLTTPYPYMSGLLHLGHLFTYTAPETIARFRRMQGFNVLFKFGFHCTGTPIVAAAQRVKEREPTQLETLKKMGIAEKEIPKFADPIHWIDYFPKETLYDLKHMGFSIDERYTFRTTSYNQPYDRFITWQFNKLKEKGFVKKGSHPVIWCPKDNMPVGDHDRSEGEGETPQEFLLFKHKLDDGTFIISATLRQDTVLGITNLFVNPNTDYSVSKVNNEAWILSEKAAKSLESQGFKVKIKSKLHGSELIGKKTEEFDKSKVLILPATFLDPDVGTGLVHSVPSDSADDLIALMDIQKDTAALKRYNLNIEEVQKIKPIPVLDTPGYCQVAAETILKKYDVKSQNDREKLDSIKQELYKLSHYTSTLNHRYKKVFSKDLEGMKVEQAKPIIAADLIKSGFAVKYYEPTGKVVCRCLTPCIVKLVDNQWFLEYNSPEWKKLTHSCLDSMTIYPEKIRKQFEYVLDWLDHWACTREYGLGTKLPWDEKWVIESLSDSTLQMAYATTSKYLEHPSDYKIDTKKLDDAFFDYIFLGKGNSAAVEKSTKIPKKLLEQMHNEFNYWYPFDFRNSAKDLLQNHLAFCLFNHTAIFPKEHWPRAYIMNGRIMVNNEKMSKSKGNFFTMRELYTKHGADIVRLTAAYAGEGVEDANYDMTFLETAKHKLSEIYEFAKSSYNKGRSDTLAIDRWFESQICNSIISTTESLENMLFKSAVQSCLMDMQRHLKWYIRRTNGKPNRRIINLFIESQLKLLAPFTPHLCEEVWHELGKKTYISNESWPVAGMIEKDSSLGEDIIAQTMEDIQRVLELAKIEKPKEITFIVADSWKHVALKEIGIALSHTREFKKIMDSLMQNPELKKHAQDLAKIIPKQIQAGSVTATTSQDFEYGTLTEASSFFKSEYGCKITVEKESASREPKARQAMPNKPSILVK